MIITRGYNATYLGKVSSYLYLMYLIILLVEARKLA